MREVSALLEISEKDVLDLAESGALAAYKVGGVYLRFKPSQVEEFKKKSAATTGQRSKEYSIADRIYDLLYFNDFYIIAFILIGAMLYFILKP
ncbi:MAG: helix-turn-helix domain-containing protein [Candidatus Omnitrophota bacterium]